MRGSRQYQEAPTGGRATRLLPAELREVARVSLKLGCLAFGGPAAHIALLREEVVVRRRWLSEQEFLDLLGVTNLIPGPNSTEMVLHCGYRRAGWPGFLLSGTLFIVPAATLVLLLAWMYSRWGALPEATWLLSGLQPVLLAVIGQAIWSLSRIAVRQVSHFVLSLATFVLYLAGVHELLLLAGAALISLMLEAVRRRTFPLFGLAPFGTLPFVASPETAVPISLTHLFFTFLKIGSVLYGSGYVLFAFLRRDFVERLGWLSDHQLLDAMAVGQITPGPVFTTATFVGYLVAGLPGALLATVAIFLPAFVFVAAIRPLAPQLRRSPWLSSLLDGLNVAAVALMAGVLWQLARIAVGDLLTAVLALSAWLALVRFRVNPAWLLIVGGSIGFLRHSLFG